MLPNDNFIVLRSEGGVIDFVGKQGCTWGPFLIALSMNGVPLDLTGYKIRGQMRKKINAPNAETGLVFAIEDPLTGVISISMKDEDSAALTCRDTYLDSQSTYYWDMEIFTEDPDPIEVYRYLSGKIYVSAEVTRDA